MIIERVIFVLLLQFIEHIMKIFIDNSLLLVCNIMNCVFPTPFPKARCEISARTKRLSLDP